MGMAFFFFNVWFPVQSEVWFRICVPNMLYLAALLKPQIYCMCISLLLHTPCYIILYMACGQEKAGKKINKKFYNMCYIFYKTHRKQCAVIPSFVLLSSFTGNSENQKQVMNVYFLAGLNRARNWCSNQRT